MLYSRRQFLPTWAGADCKPVGANAVRVKEDALMTQRSVYLIIRILLAASMLLNAAYTGPKEALAMNDDFIEVRNPVSLSVDRLAAERIPVGVPGDYKPCIAKLPTGELLLVMFYAHYLDDGNYQEDIILYRSQDGGVTWSQRQVLPLLGREPYLTVLKDGTVFITVHLLAAEWRNMDGYTHSYLHRSTDGGQTWTTTRLGAEDLPGAPPKGVVVTSRNVLELADGTLLLGVSAPHGVDYVWRSSDRGQTWDKSWACQVAGVGKDYPGPFFGETFLWRGQVGKVLAIVRVEPKFFPALKGQSIPTGWDHCDRMLLFETTDDGRMWGNPRNFGDYGEMYPAVLSLQDGRLLFTFTVRDLKVPLGVQAVLGYEDDEGLHFDFEDDQLILDPKTPENMPSGGGFGPSVQLGDGTLVTSYSYRDADFGQTHAEVVRWHLPPYPETQH